MSGFISTPSAATDCPAAGEPRGAGCRAHIPQAGRYALRRATAFPAGDQCRNTGSPASDHSAGWFSAGCPAGHKRVHGDRRYFPPLSADRDRHISV